MVYSHPSVAMETFGPTIEFAPHSSPRPGAEIRYRNYGLSFSSSLADASLGAPKFVQSGLTDARTFFYGDAWGVEGYHRYARGFYAQSGTDSNSTQISHPDMTLRSTSLTVYRAVGRETHVYRMADGLATSGAEPDFLLTFALSQNHLRDEIPFLQDVNVSGSRFDGLQNLNIYSASVGGGLALSINANGVYFDPALFVGVGMQYREWDGRGETTFNLVKANLRMRLGYRTRWFDAGAGFENDAHAALAGEESAVFSSLLARAQIQVYL